MVDDTEVVPVCLNYVLFSWTNTPVERMSQWLREAMRLSSSVHFFPLPQLLEHRALSFKIDGAFYYIFLFWFFVLFFHEFSLSLISFCPFTNTFARNTVLSKTVLSLPGVTHSWDCHIRSCICSKTFPLDPHSPRLSSAMTYKWFHWFLLQVGSFPSGSEPNWCYLFTTANRAQSLPHSLFCMDGFWCHLSCFPDGVLCLFSQLHIDGCA